MSHPGQIPFPAPELITEVVREFRPDPNEYLGLSELQINTDKYNNSPETITWDIIGPHTGMTHAYALGTDPRLVKPSVLKTKSIKTAYWREMLRLTEADLLLVRNVGPKFLQRAANMLVMEGVAKLDTRLFTRIEYLIWQVLTTGMLTLNEDGVIREINYEVPAGNMVTATNPWSDYENSDPILDIQTMSQQFVQYGGTLDTITINQQTAIWMANNAKVRSLVEKSNLVVEIGANNVGSLVMRLAGVPGTIRVYDKGYLQESDGSFVRFIPDGCAVVRAKAPSTQGKFGEFASTPSLFNGGIQNATGGRYVRTEDKSDNMMRPHYDIMQGIHGLPVLFQPYLLSVWDVGQS